jgi:O-antigen/teichoic acid export membrane protein
MKSNGLKRNFIFQILYQFVVLVIPLVTAPYLTRVLQDTNLGIYTFTYSIAYYFIVAAMLGISKYGQRVIASRKKNEYALRRTYWSRYFVHTIISLISISTYTIFALLQQIDRTIYIYYKYFMFYQHYLILHGFSMVWKVLNL